MSSTEGVVKENPAAVSVLGSQQSRTSVGLYRQLIEQHCQAYQQKFAVAVEHDEHNDSADVNGELRPEQRDFIRSKILAAMEQQQGRFLLLRDEATATGDNADVSVGVYSVMHDSDADSRGIWTSIHRDLTLTCKLKRNNDSATATLSLELESLPTEKDVVLGEGRVLYEPTLYQQILEQNQIVYAQIDESRDRWQQRLAHIEDRIVKPVQAQQGRFLLFKKDAAAATDGTTRSSANAKAMSSSWEILDPLKPSHQKLVFYSIHRGFKDKDDDGKELQSLEDKQQLPQLPLVSPDKGPSSTPQNNGQNMQRDNAIMSPTCITSISTGTQEDKGSAEAETKNGITNNVISTGTQEDKLQVEAETKNGITNNGIIPPTTATSTTTAMDADKMTQGEHINGVANDRKQLPGATATTTTVTTGTADDSKNTTQVENNNGVAKDTEGKAVNGVFPAVAAKPDGISAATVATTGTTDDHVKLGLELLVGTNNMETEGLEGAAPFHPEVSELDAFDLDAFADGEVDDYMNFAMGAEVPGADFLHNQACDSLMIGGGGVAAAVGGLHGVGLGSSVPGVAGSNTTCVSPDASAAKPKPTRKTRKPRVAKAVRATPKATRGKSKRTSKMTPKMAAAAADAAEAARGTAKKSPIERKKRIYVSSQHKLPPPPPVANDDTSTAAETLAEDMLSEREMKPTKYDCVFGRGRKKDQVRKGSLYRFLIEKYWLPYSQLDTTKFALRREYVKQKILDVIMRYNGRFIMREGLGMRLLDPLDKENDLKTIYKKVQRSLFNERKRNEALGIDTVVQDDDDDPTPDGIFSFGRREGEDLDQWVEDAEQDYSEHDPSEADAEAADQASSNGAALEKEAEQEMPHDVSMSEEEGQLSSNGGVLPFDDGHRESEAQPQVDSISVVHRLHAMLGEHGIEVDSQAQADNNETTPTGAGWNDGAMDVATGGGFQFEEQAVAAETQHQVNNMAAETGSSDIANGSAADGSFLFEEGAVKVKAEPQIDNNETMAESTKPQGAVELEVSSMFKSPGESDNNRSCTAEPDEVSSSVLLVTRDSSDRNDDDNNDDSLDGGETQPTSEDTTEEQRPESTTRDPPQTNGNGGGAAIAAGVAMLGAVSSSSVSCLKQHEEIGPSDIAREVETEAEQQKVSDDTPEIETATSISSGTKTALEIQPGSRATLEVDSKAEVVTDEEYDRLDLSLEQSDNTRVTVNKRRHHELVDFASKTHILPRNHRSGENEELLSTFPIIDRSNKRQRGNRQRQQSYRGLAGKGKSNEDV